MGTSSPGNRREPFPEGTRERGWSPPRAPVRSQIPNARLGRSGGRRKAALVGRERAKKKIWGFLHPPHLIHPHNHSFSSKTQTQCTALGLPWQACSYNSNCPQGKIIEYFQSVPGVTERQKPAEMSPDPQTCSGEGFQWEKVSNPLLPRGSTSSSKSDGSGSSSRRC